MTRLRPGAASAGSCILDQKPSRSLAGNLFGISLVMETPSLRFGRETIQHTKRRAGNGREEYPEPRKRYGNALAEMVSCGVPSGNRVHPPYQQLCHRTQDHKNLRFKLSDVPLKHPWRPIRAESHIQGWRLGRLGTVTGEIQNQGCLGV